MDFTSEQLDQGLNGLGALTGDDQSVMSGLSPAAKNEHITSEIGALMNSKLGKIIQPEGGMDSFDPANVKREPSARDQAGQRFNDALKSKSKSPNDIRAMGMAHILWMKQAGMNVPENVNFAPSDSNAELTEAEVKALDGISSFYKTDNRVALQNDFSNASAIASGADARQKQELEAEEKRTADIIHVKKGMVEMGYMPADTVIDGTSTTELREALSLYALDTHMGAQASGPAADYANEHHNGADAATQWFAIYEKGSHDMQDTGMARALVDAGRDTTRFPATLENATGGVNHAAVEALAERGGLRAVPDHYLTQTQREIFDALGGQDTAAGQKKLATYINADNGKAWYEKGLQQIPTPKQEAHVEVVQELAEEREVEVEQEFGIGDGLDRQLASLTYEEISQFPENIREPLYLLKDDYDMWKQSEIALKAAYEIKDPSEREQGVRTWEAAANSDSLTYAQRVHDYEEIGVMDDIKTHLSARQENLSPVAPEIDYQAPAPFPMEAPADTSMNGAAQELGSIFQGFMNGGTQPQVAAMAGTGPKPQEYRK